MSGARPKLARMTELAAPNGLAVRQQQAGQLAPAVTSSFGLPDNFMDQLRLAELVAKSDLVDKKLQGKPENVFMVVQKAIGLSISFDLAIAKTHVIDNKVTPSAELLRILLRRAGHDLEIFEHNDKVAKATLTLAHRPDRPITMEYTVAKAQAAGYTNKPIWKNDAESMLVAAVTRRLVRFHCPEVAAGLDLSDDTVGAEFGVVDVPARHPGPVRAAAQRVDEPDTVLTENDAEAAPSSSAAESDDSGPATTDPALERARQIFGAAQAAVDVATLTRLGKEARAENLLDTVVDGAELTLNKALRARLQRLQVPGDAQGDS